MKSICCLVILMVFLFKTQNGYTQKEYTSYYTSDRPIIDGHKDKLWQIASLDRLNHFFNAKAEDHKALSTFQMLWDEENIYLFYEVKDKYINTATTKRDGATFLDDCAEIFISPKLDERSVYFCFETNVLEKTNDIVVVKGKGEEKPIILKGYNPEFKVAVNINGTLNNNADIDKGWTLEMAIPLKAFSRFSEFNPIKNGAKWSFLVVKQDRDEEELGYRTMATNFEIDNIKEKDVHQPEQFGAVLFKKK